MCVVLTEIKGMGCGRMRRIVVPVLVSLLVVLVVAGPVNAGMWCKADPVISLNGAVVDISVAIPLEYVLLVNGPVVYEVRTPKSVDRQVVFNDLGFGHGSEIVFTDGSGVVTDDQIPMRVRVHVPIDESKLAPGETVPAELTVIDPLGGIHVVEGTSERTDLKVTIQGNTL